MHSVDVTVFPHEGGKNSNIHTVHFPWRRLEHPLVSLNNQLSISSVSGKHPSCCFLPVHPMKWTYFLPLDYVFIDIFRINIPTQSDFLNAPQRKSNSDYWIIYDCPNTFCGWYFKSTYKITFSFIDSYPFYSKILVVLYNVRNVSP